MHFVATGFECSPASICLHAPASWGVSHCPYMPSLRMSISLTAAWQLAISMDCDCATAAAPCACIAASCCLAEAVFCSCCALAAVASHAPSFLPDMVMANSPSFDFIFMEPLYSVCAAL